MTALGAVLHVDRRVQQQSPRVGEDAALTGPNTGGETGGGIWPCTLAQNRATCSSKCVDVGAKREVDGFVGPIGVPCAPRVSRCLGAGVSRQG
jgi:hypothetical protein